ncbi:hypothetical protein E2C01_041993 [Portunus trituberculatus]|uniref:Uncharacterized protein n=1 Tax=Portunus trituberculatus TaxID=210409 RepID=A0A5B7FS65_PORTR|nr:hypothetical protein [Portunus trituberculatus]
MSLLRMRDPGVDDAAACCEVWHGSIQRDYGEAMTDARRTSAKETTTSQPSLLLVLTGLTWNLYCPTWLYFDYYNNGTCYIESSKWYDNVAGSGELVSANPNENLLLLPFLQLHELCKIRNPNLTEFECSNKIIIVHIGFIHNEGRPELGHPRVSSQLLGTNHEAQGVMAVRTGLGEVSESSLVRLEETRRSLAFMLFRLCSEPRPGPEVRARCGGGRASIRGLDGGGAGGGGVPLVPLPLSDPPALEPPWSVTRSRGG